MNPLPTEPLVPPGTWRDAQLLEMGQNSRVDHTMKAILPLRTAGLQIPALASAWLMPSYPTMQSLCAPTAAAKKQQLLELSVKYVRMIADPGAAGNFKQLLNTWKSFHVLTPRQAGDAVYYICNCSIFWKTSQCSHAVALGIRQKVVAIPVDRSLKALGRKKRSRGGRYAKAKSALTRQDDEEYDRQDAGTAFASSQAEDPCCYACGDRRSTVRNRIVFCDGCDFGYHQNCIIPPLRTLPAGPWYCGRDYQANSNRERELEVSL